MGAERKEPVPAAAFQAFFQEVPRTITPPCRYLCVPGPEGQFPRNLLVDPDGTLFWLAGTDPSVRFLPRAGGPRYTTLPGESRLLALALAPQGWIWMFGERDFGVAQSSTLTRLSLPGAAETANASPDEALVRFWASPVAAVPEAIQALPGGEVILSLPDRTLRFAVTETGESGAPVKADYTQEDVHPAVPARDRLATANGGWRWTVSRGRQAQAEHLAGKATRSFELPFAAHAAAADPEGNLWFTEGTQGTRIGRLSPDGQTAQVELGPDLHAMEIVHGAEQAYFTVHQAHWLGALWRARVAPGAGPKRRSLEELNFVFEPYKPRPERSRKVRPRANSQPAPAPPPGSAAVLRAAEAGLQRPAVGAPGPAKAPAAPAPPSPAALLKRWGVSFPPDIEAHILEGHGAEAPAGNSRFAPAFHSGPALQALVAKGLDDAGTLGMLIGPKGNFETLCRRVGGVGRLGDQEPTEYFLVVTRPDGRMVTAYPERQGRR